MAKAKPKPQAQQTSQPPGLNTSQTSESYSPPKPESASSTPSAPGQEPPSLPANPSPALPSTPSSPTGGTGGAPSSSKSSPTSPSPKTNPSESLKLAPESKTPAAIHRPPSPPHDPVLGAAGREFLKWAAAHQTDDEFRDYYLGRHDWVAEKYADDLELAPALARLAKL
jgi:hypothetical protein